MIIGTSTNYEKKVEKTFGLNLGVGIIALMHFFSYSV